ncbi:MAG: hypothetical protein LBF54_01110 [Holosporaceae bacterium]|jgi:hypothetical protein|nr:hypothetical protein [Holosporaceae bacterium]
MEKKTLKTVKAMVFGGMATLAFGCNGMIIEGIQLDGMPLPNGTVITTGWTTKDGCEMEWELHVAPNGTLTPKLETLIWRTPSGHACDFTITNTGEVCATLETLGYSLLEKPVTFHADLLDSYMTAMRDDVAEVKGMLGVGAMRAYRDGGGRSLAVLAGLNRYTDVREGYLQILRDLEVIIPDVER